MVVRLIKITLMITFLVVVSAASFIWGYSAHRETEVDYFNGLLYNLDIEVDLLEHWNENNHNDKYFERRIKHLILNKLLVLSEYKPPIKDLQGVPIKALHRLISYNNTYKLTSDQNDTIFQIATNYLKSIESDVDLRIKEEREMLRNLKIK